jgi:hypothetical protein
VAEKRITPKAAATEKPQAKVPAAGVEKKSLRKRNKKKTRG